MIDSARKQDVHDEVRRGDEALRAADALMAVNLYGDAISRAYYGAWHYLRALLLTRSVEARSHAGAIHLFNTELVKKGVMSAKHNRILSGLQRAANSPITTPLSVFLPTTRARSSQTLVNSLPQQSWC